MIDRGRACVENLSKITLGTVQLGMNYGMANVTGQPSREQAFQILDTAALVGINSLDTAVAYGTSEQVIGDYLHERKTDFFVTSKFKVSNEDPSGDLQQKIYKTRQHLDKVDLYLFHDGQNMIQHAKRLEEPLRRMKEEGFTRFLGASVYEVEEIEAFLQFDWLTGIQIPMNILDGRIVQSGLLEEMQKRGITVFVRSVFLQGLLCMERAPERYAFLNPFVEELRDVAKAEKMSLMELAVAYIRDLPGVSSLVLGCENVEQVQNNAELITVQSVSPAGAEAVRSIASKVPIEEAMLRIQGKK